MTKVRLAVLLAAVAFGATALATPAVAADTYACAVVTKLPLLPPVKTTVVVQAASLAQAVQLAPNLTGVVGTVLDVRCVKS
ncbi:hypothetical protein Cs7R123_17370 [Catellatospora sp. TT07R-123]|uniref:hypothetical protein n=1 Tax=Catellatospora sp. TT07R-123 TaxID=2733863 RepID=UPI001B1B9955|nr:hypothetical protein [Catellatospora sp. TT07R-123]GHJ44395.1 hypothetical protein Cs7R123_17370 [Catellatospora sp. TT07R-123]